METINLPRKVVMQNRSEQWKVVSNWHLLLSGSEEERGNGWWEVGQESPGLQVGRSRWDAVLGTKRT